jgi:hypothetical protein
LANDPARSSKIKPLEAARKHVKNKSEGAYSVITMFKFLFIFHHYAVRYGFPESYLSRIREGGILSDLERRFGQLNIMKLIGRGKVELTKEEPSGNVRSASTFTSHSYEHGVEILIGQL